MNYLHSFLLTICLKSLLSNANDEGWAYPKISWMENKSPGAVNQKILFKTSQSNNIVYRIIHDDSFSDIFELTTSKNEKGQNVGTLTIKKRLDREEKDEYNLQIGAFDQSTEQQLKFTTVTISIMDQNDNKPEITNPVGQVYSVLEKVQDAIVTRINVRDLDAGENAAIDFQSPTNLVEHRRDGTQSLIPDNEVISYFRIDSNGDLRTSGHGTLDAEKVEKYRVFILKSELFIH